MLDTDDEAERKQFFHHLSARQLKRHGAKYVVAFELYRGARHVYTLYFATRNLKGCNLMKSCIWKLDREGTFKFRSYAVGQLSLFGADTSRLARQLRDEFGTEWTSIEEVDEFVMGDGTPFHVGQLRRDTLRTLEAKGKIEVRRPQGGRGFTTGKGIRIRFK